MQKYCIANTFLIPRTLYLSQKHLRHPYPFSSWGITFKYCCPVKLKRA